jgi:hypothetical protein
MALAAAVEGATRPSQVITWTRADDTPEDLTGATLTGVILNVDTNETRAIAGTLTVTTAASGIFTWAYHANDVADAGSFKVQITASFGSAPTPARTIIADWSVHEELSV